MKNEPAFINRRRELAFLDSWIAERPNNLLFMYGPKSSGKTTLLMEFVRRSLSSRDYEVKNFNLRELLLTSYKDFIRSFFCIDYSKAKGDVKEVRSYSLPFFQLSVEVLKGIESTDLDPLAVMAIELEKIVASGQRPVIIIDELQALEGIYMNGQRELLQELFNFFVAITKESHLCHVIVASSDAYFIQRIYDDAKLKKTSAFFAVDYLTKPDVVYWLDNLQQESNISEYQLSPEQKDTIWNTYGGSMWEISRFLGDLLVHVQDSSIPDETFAKLIEERIVVARSMFKLKAIGTRKKQLFRSIAAAVSASADGSFDHDSIAVDMGDNAELEAELGDLVRNNLLALDPTQAHYQLQGRLLELGLARYVSELAAGIPAPDS